MMIVVGVSMRRIIRCVNLRITMKMVIVGINTSCLVIGRCKKQQQSQIVFQYASSLFDDSQTPSLQPRCSSKWLTFKANAMSENAGSRENIVTDLFIRPL